MDPFLVSAPARIDFAGGTLDLWPLCAFLAPVTTVNHSISLRLSARFSKADGPNSVAISKDLGLKLVVQQQAPACSEGPLALVALALRCLPPPHPVIIETSSPVPKGSGLGASSTLLIAILSGLCRLRGEQKSHGELVSLARDIEAQLIEVPTGTQDYWGALGGGLNVIEYGVGNNLGTAATSVELGPQIADLCRSQLQIYFTGEAHFSGAPNWSMLRAYVENHEAGLIRRNFRSIVSATHQVVEAIKQDSPEAFLAGIRAEWAARRKLAPEVCPPRLDVMLEKMLEAGASALKLCGAGGGGSMLAFVPADKQQNMDELAAEYGATNLKAGLANQAVQFIEN